MELQDIASQINFHHEQAMKCADAALEHAMAAGLLLLKQKELLPHGQFIPWMRKNLKGSIRQKQRYMAYAAGKPVAIRQLSSKSDIVSHLKNPNDQGKVVDGKWIPNLGFHYCYATDEAAVWVVPDSKSCGFHVSKFYQIERDPNVDPEIYADPDNPYDEREWDGTSVYDGTNYPMPADMIDLYLRHIIGLKEPTEIEWFSFPGAGLDRPFGEPSSCKDDEPKIAKIKVKNET
jgi:hypothetical protein